MCVCLKVIEQGDPLSTFLFIICSEGFSSILRRAELEGQLDGIQFGRGGPKLSHLFFADDSLLFAKASVNSARELKAMLDHYAALSGQLINFDKSSIFFSKGASELLINSIVDCLGVSRGVGRGKYLGLPFITGRSKKDLFNEIKDRIWKKLAGWKEKLLSAAGKEVLIKSVVQAIPTYTMQCFKIPVSTCDDIVRMTRNFWWGQKHDERKIAWKAWDDLCLPKREGGLGFRNISLFNQALLAKQCWRIIQIPNSMVAQILKGKYFPNAEFLEAGAGARPSFVWRSLLHGRSLLEKGLRWRVGDGTQISCWEAPWIPLNGSFTAANVRKHLLPEAKVADLIDHGTKQWKADLLASLFFPHEVDAVLIIPLCHSNATDKLIWHYDSKGVYSMRSGYWLAFHEWYALSRQPARASLSNNGHWCKIWQLKLPPKVKIFAWRAATKSLATGDNLLKRRLTDGRCNICWSSIETDRHCFFDCDWTRRVWTNIQGAMGWIQRPAQSLRNLLMDMLESDVQLGTLYIAVMWCIWNARNHAIFDNQPISISRVCTNAETLVEDFAAVSMKLEEGEGTSSEPNKLQ